MKYLNFSFLAILLLTSFFVISCNSSKNSNLSNTSPSRTNANDSSNNETNQPPKLVVVKLRPPDQEPMIITTELKYGGWGIDSSKDDNFEFLRQNYCLSNTPNIGQEFTVSPDGETVRICFSINESKRWKDKSPLSPGVYYIGNDERSDMGKITAFTLEAAQGKQRFTVNIEASSTYGNLTIENSTENFISGKFALSDKNISVNGNFGTKLQ